MGEGAIKLFNVGLITEINNHTLDTGYVQARTLNIKCMRGGVPDNMTTMNAIDVEFWVLGFAELNVDNYHAGYVEVQFPKWPIVLCDVDLNSDAPYAG